MISDDSATPRGGLCPAGRAAGGVALLAAVLLASALPRPGEARSSLTARFAAPVAAGSAGQQSALLYIDFFPGDGEAVTHLDLAVPASQVRVHDVTSRRGHPTPSDGAVLIDYSEKPIGERGADTLSLTLTALRLGSVPFLAGLVTNVDTAAAQGGSARAHMVRVPLRVEAPLGADLRVEPRRVYPGEAVEITLTAVNRDPEGRVLEGLHVRWPEGIGVSAPPQGRQVAAAEVAAAEAAPGDSLSVSWTVRVQRPPRSLELAVAVEGGGLTASPLPVVALEVGALPDFETEALPGPAVRGHPLTLRLSWRNRSEGELGYQALEARTLAGFADVHLGVGQPGEVRLEADEEKGSLRVRVAGPGRLAPGGEVVVEVSARPTGTGPFVWTGFFQPADRAAPVTLGPPAVVQVVASPELVTEVGQRSMLTDLELAGQGLQEALATALQDLPLAPGTAVALVADARDDGNWVVEETLTALLLGRGIRVLAAPEAGGHTLRYRVADARVVYTEVGSRWNPFSERHRRDACIDVYTRLEDARDQVLWARRVSSRAGDTAPAPAAWLGGARGIGQAAVAADHRAVELGLSGFIMGGLFFVFFAP